MPRSPAGSGGSAAALRCSVVLLAGLVLAGCSVDVEGRPSPSTAAERAPASLPATHWANATYRSTCDGLAHAPFEVRLRDGEGQASGSAAATPEYDTFDVTLRASATGDLDGDGAPDTAVVLRCAPQPSNGFVEEVQVFGSGGNLLGALPSPTTLADPASLPPLYDEHGLAVSDGVLVAHMRAYGPQDSHATGPSEPLLVRWRWNGSEFSRIS